MDVSVMDEKCAEPKPEAVGQSENPDQNKTVVNGELSGQDEVLQSELNSANSPKSSVNGTVPKHDNDSVIEQKSEALEPLIQTPSDDSDLKIAVSSKSTVQDDGNDSDRSSSPDIVHIRTIAPPPKKTQEDLKRLFEQEYITGVVIKVQTLLLRYAGGKLGDSENAGQENCKSSEVSVSRTSNHESSVNDSETNGTTEPSPKKAKLDDDVDDEIEAIKTIDHSVIPGFSPALESKFCDLWDLSSQRNVAEFLFVKQTLPLFREIIVNSPLPILKEISFGIIANMCCVNQVCTAVSDDSSLRQIVLDKLRSEKNNDVICQILKLICICLQNEKFVWIDDLKKESILQCLKPLFESGSENVIERLSDFLDCAFDLSDDIKASACQTGFFTLICKSLSKLGVRDDDESNVEIMGCLLRILVHMSSVKGDHFAENRDLLMATLDSLLESVEEKELIFTYKSTLNRIIELSGKAFVSLDGDEEQKAFLGDYTRVVSSLFDFLDLFDHEEESGIGDTDFSDLHGYHIIKQCSLLLGYIEDLRNRIGDEAFFSCFEGELKETVKSGLEMYIGDDKNDGSDGSDTEILEIDSSSAHEADQESSVNDTGEAHSETPREDAPMDSEDANPADPSATQDPSDAKAVDETCGNTEVKSSVSHIDSESAIHPENAGVPESDGASQSVTREAVPSHSVAPEDELAPLGSGQESPDLSDTDL